MRKAIKVHVSYYQFTKTSPGRDDVSTVASRDVQDIRLYVSVVGIEITQKVCTTVGMIKFDLHKTEPKWFNKLFNVALEVDAALQDKYL